MWTKQEATAYFADPQKYRHLLHALTDKHRKSAFIGGIHQDYLQGLQQTTNAQFKRAIIVLDNSGSTRDPDGKVYTDMNWETGRFNRRTTTRLNEICQRAIDSLMMYRFLGLPCTVAPLNQKAFKVDRQGRIVYTDNGELAVAEMHFDGKTEASFQACIDYILEIRTKFDDCDCGTPLRATLERLMPQGDADHSGVILNIITDGVPSARGPTREDRIAEQKAIAEMLKERGIRFQKLNIVLNLTTEDADTMDFYGELVDAVSKEVNVILKRMHLEENRLNADVLDDFWGERNEIFGFNPDVSYALLLHLLRVSGVLAHTKMDILDERRLFAPEYVALAQDLLVRKKIGLTGLKQVLAGMPAVYQPTRLGPKGDEYYEDGVGVDRPLFAPKALIQAIIDSKDKANALKRGFLSFRGVSMPTAAEIVEVQRAQARGVRALVVPGAVVEEEPEVVVVPAALADNDPAPAYVAPSAYVPVVPGQGALMVSQERMRATQQVYVPVQQTPHGLFPTVPTHKPAAYNPAYEPSAPPAELVLR
jgi:hypothetical protein